MTALFDAYARNHGRLIVGIAVAFALFQLYTVGFGVSTPLAQRGTTLLFAAILAFLTRPLLSWAADGSRTTALRAACALVDAALIGVAVWTCLYVIQNEAALADRSGAETDLDLLVAVAGPVMLIEMVRRTVGAPLAIIVAAVALYAYHGDIVLVIGLPLGAVATAWALGGLPAALGAAAVAAAVFVTPLGGPLLDPSGYQYQGVSLYRMAPYLWLTSEGTFGSIAGIMSQFIFIFVLFSAFLETLGSGKTLIDLAFAGTGRFRGGPAQAAVAGSSLFGMVSGSTMANVVSTGTLTIPLMIRAGFQKRFAAAVEAVASSGGQIVPPIMGASVFIMAEIIGVPYVQLMLYALIPAFFYFLSLSSSIYFEAGRLGVGRLSASEIPNGRRALLTGGFVIIPLLILLLSIVGGETPGRAGFKAVLALLVMSDIVRSFVLLRSERGMGAVLAVGLAIVVLIALAFGPVAAPGWASAPIALPLVGEVAPNRLLLWAAALAILVTPGLRALPPLVLLWLATAEWELQTQYALLGDQTWIVFVLYAVMAVLGALLVVTPSRLREATADDRLGPFLGAVLKGLETGSRNAVSLVAATYGIGMVVGLLVLTGLGVRLSILVSQVGEHALFLSYILVMCASLILGMGLPTVAAYLLLVMVVAPSMEQLGTPIVAAHMFVFYYGVLSSITPPVALAAFGAAGIARVDPLSTALTACRLALSAFIVPFLFVYHPELLLLEGDAAEVLYRLAICGFGVWLVSAAMIGFALRDMTKAERALLLAAALLLFWDGMALNAVGAALGIGLLWRQRGAAQTAA